LIRNEIDDQIATHRHQCLDSLGPQCGDDVGSPRAPVESGEKRALNLQRIHERDDVGRQYGLLPVAHRVRRPEARAAVPAQVGHEHAVALRRQDRRDVDIAVDVIRPAVKQDYRRTVGGAVLRVSDVEYAGVNRFERGVRRV
jgi:hypothetical protein